MSCAITVLADGFEEIESVTYIDLLRRGGVDVTVLGLESINVRGAHNVWIKADMPFDEFHGDMFDAIILPGGMPGTNNLAASNKLLDLIRHANKQNKICAAICAAPIVFAKAGILDNMKATCYPGCENRLSGALPVEEAVVTDRNIITSRAVGTAIPFALELIKILAGEGMAEQIKTTILY